MALVAGGWNDALLVEEGDQSEYLKLMTMYTMLLAQAEEENVPVDLTDLVQTPEVHSSTTYTAGQKKPLQLLFYVAKAPTSDGYSTI